MAVSWPINLFHYWWFCHHFSCPRGGRWLGREYQLHDTHGPSTRCLVSPGACQVGGQCLLDAVCNRRVMISHTLCEKPRMTSRLVRTRAVSLSSPQIMCSDPTHLLGGHARRVGCSVSDDGRFKLAHSNLDEEACFWPGIVSILRLELG